MAFDPIEFFKSQGDYLAFLGIATGILVTIAVLLPRFRRDARLPHLVWVVVATVLGIGWWLTEREADNTREERIAQVSALAPTYAYELSHMGHARLTSDAPADDPLYLSLIHAEMDWQKLNPCVNDIYTFRKRADGTNILVVDSETDYDRNGNFSGDNESRTPIGKVYPQTTAALERAFQGESTFDTDIYTDEWGTWVSAFVPMHDADGKVEAVLGVDFDAKTWLIAIAAARRNVIFAVALVLIIVAGGAVSIALLTADVKERTQAQLQTRRSEERLLLTIRQMPLGFIEWDVNARPVLWNPAAEHTFGYVRDEAIGKSMFPLIVAPSAREHVDKLWASLLQKQDGVHSINENITKAGQTITCEWFNTPLIDAAGNVSGVFSVVQDITERLKLQNHMQQSDRMAAIGQLAAGMAHDFNNILTVITGHTGLLLAANNLPEQTCTDVKRIESAAMRAATLTRQLLAFSRKQALFPRPMHVTTAIETATSMLSRLLGPDLKLDVQIAPNVPPVEADAAMLEQVITNLVINARDAITGTGQISVSLEATVVTEQAAAKNPDARPGPAVCLSVGDTGSGIAPDHLARIFEPFFSTKPKGRGTGLGLSVVLGIVQQHNGWIQVDSKLGEGTTFHIFLPPTDKPVASQESDPHPVITKPPTAPAAPRANQTVLLAEDEKPVRDLARSSLQKAGFRVLEAADGHEALALWKSHRDEIDLLLTDMVMPNGMTGRELSRKILEDRPALPVIYASGYSVELHAPDFKMTDRSVFIAKPYMTSQLVSSVRSCLAKVTQN